MYTRRAYIILEYYLIVRTIRVHFLRPNPIEYSMNISVVIPVGSQTPELRRTRAYLRTQPVQVILVTDDSLSLTAQGNERVVQTPRRGRGYAIMTGIRHANKDICLILHADTRLPTDGLDAITRVMREPRILGGGFSLAFDKDSIFLRSLVSLTRIGFSLTGEFWGDRGCFVRTLFAKTILTRIDVPIMEDVILSTQMRKNGKTILLPQRVITSNSSFVRLGLLRHTWRIAKLRTLYQLGYSLDKIYSHYYKKD